MTTQNQRDPCLECHFRGHKDAVTCVDFKPNLKQLASGSLDNAVILWNFKKNMRAFRLVGHKEPVTCVKFSRDGECLASSSVDQTVRLWTPSIEGKSSIVKQHVAPVRSVDFSPDGLQLLTASDDKSVKICALKPQRFLSSMSEHLNWVRCARFSNNGNMVASGSDDRTIKLWDPKCKSTLHTFVEQPGNVVSLDFHPSDLHLATASANHVCIHDMRTRKLLQIYECNTKTVRGVAFHSSGRYVLTGGDDSIIRILDICKGRLYYTVLGHTKPVNGVCFSRDGDFFSTAGSDRLVTVWKTNLDSEELPFPDSILEHRGIKNEGSLREMDATMMLEDDEDVEVTDIQPKLKFQNLDPFNTCENDIPQNQYLEVIQGLVQQVDTMSKTIQVLESRLELLENKFDAQY